MNLVSMKKTPEQLKEDKPEAISSGSTEEYPYGLTLDIRDDQVGLLGLTDANVGDEIMIHAKAKVVRTSESKRESSDGKKVSSNVDLQITDMKIKKPGDDVDRAKELYS